MHKQAEVAQETPYRFDTAAELAAPTTCAPNRGGTAGSLLLVNHWVDTSPAPRKSIAREVNAPASSVPGWSAAARSAAWCRTSSPSTSTARATCSTPWSDR